VSDARLVALLSAEAIARRARKGRHDRRRRVERYLDDIASITAEIAKVGAHWVVDDGNARIGQSPMVAWQSCGHNREAPSLLDSGSPVHSGAASEEDVSTLPALSPEVEAEYDQRKGSHPELTSERIEEMKLRRRLSDAREHQESTGGAESR